MAALSGLNFKIEVQISEACFDSRRGTSHKSDSHMYIFPKGESLLENIYNRRNRPYQMYKKEVIPLVLGYMEYHYPEIYSKFRHTEWRWSKNCGCTSCPCSPGFHGRSIGLPYDIYVNLSENK